MADRRNFKASSHWYMTAGEVVFVVLMVGWLLAVVVADEGAPLPHAGGPTVTISQ